MDDPVRFFFAQDNSTHWYLVPERLRQEWDDWCELDEDDEDLWTPPAGAVPLGTSPSHWTFTNPLPTPS